MAQSAQQPPVRAYPKQTSGSVSPAVPPSKSSLQQQNGRPAAVQSSTQHASVSPKSQQRANLRASVAGDEDDEQGSYIHVQNTVDQQLLEHQVQQQISNNMNGGKRSVSSKLQRQLFKDATIGQAPSGSSADQLCDVTVSFAFAFTPRDLINGNKPRFEKRVNASALQMWQIRSIDDSNPLEPKIVYSGNPSRAMLKKIKWVEKKSDAPFDVSYFVNHIPMQTTEKQLRRRQILFEDGKSALDVAGAGEHAVAGKTRGEKGFLWKNDATVDPLLYQKWGDVRESDLQRGVAPWEGTSDEEEVVITIAGPNVPPERSNEIIPFMLHRSEAFFEENYGVKYSKLVEQAKAMKKIILPKSVHEAAVKLANVNGIQEAQKHLRDLPQTTVTLGAPYGGEPGEFGSAFAAWMKEQFGPRAEYYMDINYHVKISLKFVYALALPSSAR